MMDAASSTVVSQQSQQASPPAEPLHHSFPLSIEVCKDKDPHLEPARMERISTTEDTRGRHSANRGGQSHNAPAGEGRSAKRCSSEKLSLVDTPRGEDILQGGRVSSGTIVQPGKSSELVPIQRGDVGDHTRSLSSMLRHASPIAGSKHVSTKTKLHQDHPKDFETNRGLQHVDQSGAGILSSAHKALSCLQEPGSKIDIPQARTSIEKKATFQEPKATSQTPGSLNITVDSNPGSQTLTSAQLSHSPPSARVTPTTGFLPDANVSPLFALQSRHISLSIPPVPDKSRKSATTISHFCADDVPQGVLNRKMEPADCLLFAASLMKEATSTSRTKSTGSTSETKASNPQTVGACVGQKSCVSSEQPQGVAVQREPSNVDVLCGRGGLINKHPGNIVYRRVVEHNREYYKRVTKKHRILVSRSIVQSVNNSGGRFLILGTQGGPTWTEIDFKRAVLKTSQALRERATSHEKSKSSMVPTPPTGSQVVAQETLNAIPEQA